MGKRQLLLASVGLAVVMLAASFLMIAVVNAQGAGPNQIVIRNQDTSTGQLTIDLVIAAQDGFVGIYTDTTAAFSSMIGWTSVRQGRNTNLNVNIDAEIAEPCATLWAVLHVDRGVSGHWDWPGVDEPVSQDGQMVMVPFATTPDAPAEPATPVAIAEVVPQATATVAVAAPQAQATAVGAPQTLPPAGGSARLPVGWLALIGVGILFVAAGMILPRVRV